MPLKTLKRSHGSKPKVFFAVRVNTMDAELEFDVEVSFISMTLVSG